IGCELWVESCGLEALPPVGCWLLGVGCWVFEVLLELGSAVAPASSISYSQFAFTPFSRLRLPLRQSTSILIWLVRFPAANTRIASSQDKYLPPQIISWLCTGTAPS